MSKSKPAPGSKVMVYIAGTRGKVAMNVAVASPAEIRRSLKLSPTSRRRVERILKQLGTRRKAG